MNEPKNQNCGVWFFPFIFLLCFAMGSHHRLSTRLGGRIKALERIVGTETPASMTWTNGHTYTTLVKHSANCPCVK